MTATKMEVQTINFHLREIRYALRNAIDSDDMETFHIITGDMEKLYQPLCISIQRTFDEANTNSEAGHALYLKYLKHYLAFLWNNEDEDEEEA